MNAGHAATDKTHLNGVPSATEFARISRAHHAASIIRQQAGLVHVLEYVAIIPTETLFERCANVAVKRCGQTL